MANDQIVPYHQKVVQLRASITKLTPELQKALPRHMDVKRLVRMLYTALNQVPGLAECSERSLLQAAMECAQAGLEPGVLGQAYIIPFKSKHSSQKVATFIPGYKGLITLGRRSGELQDVYAEVVYDVDKFDVRRGTSPSLTHEPNYDQHVWTNVQEEAKHIVGFYAVSFLKDTPLPHFEYMTKRQVDAVMRRSPGHGDSGPWVTDYTEMGKKTVLRRLMKFMPMSSEDLRLQIAIARDEQRDAGMEIESDPQIIDAIATVIPEEGPQGAAGSGWQTTSKLDQMAQKVEQDQKGKPAAAETTAVTEVGPGDIDLGDGPVESGEAGNGDGRGTPQPLPPKFASHQKALFDALMEKAGGDNEKALALLAKVSVIRPGNVEQNLTTWLEVAERGTQVWMKQAMKKVNEL